MAKDQKINYLLNSQPHGIVYLSSWLTEYGFSSQLLNRYKKSNWIYSVGIGGWMRKGDSPNSRSNICTVAAGKFQHP
ncbi:AbiEi antitoxin N-terminal domain-containing protein [Algoriphagus aquimarinus]|uniref:AbiEi antitoxin N-terminal domain-containing protein n=1 Tax=Algoriphagus aquimarinus TaxID=237018 RepID=UPI003C6D2258